MAAACIGPSNGARALSCIPIGAGINSGGGIASGGSCGGAEDGRAVLAPPTDAASSPPFPPLATERALPLRPAAAGDFPRADELPVPPKPPPGLRRSIDEADLLRFRAEGRVRVPLRLEGPGLLMPPAAPAPASPLPGDRSVAAQRKLLRASGPDSEGSPGSRSVTRGPACSSKAADSSAASGPASARLPRDAAVDASTPVPSAAPAPEAAPSLPSLPSSGGRTPVASDATEPPPCTLPRPTLPPLLPEGCSVARRALLDRRAVLLPATLSLSRALSTAPTAGSEPPAAPASVTKNALSPSPAAPLAAPLPAASPSAAALRSAARAASDRRVELPPSAALLLLLLPERLRGGGGGAPSRPSACLPAGGPEASGERLRACCD